MNRSSNQSWEELSRLVAPPLGAVTVVVSSLVADGEELEAFCHCLSKEEQARQQRFVPPEVKRRFGVCRGRLRHLLGTLLGTSAADIRFEYNSAGKPRLAANHRSSLEFNVSHSGEWALFVFGVGFPVGVDTELFQRRTNFVALAPQVLNANEQKQLELLPLEDRNLAVMRAWVAKEALLKAIGVGIGYGLHSVEFPMPQPGVCAPLKIDAMLLAKMDDDASCKMNSWIDAPRWRVHQLDALPEGYSAVACASSIKQVIVAKY